MVVSAFFFFVQQLRSGLYETSFIDGKKKSTCLSFWSVGNSILTQRRIHQHCQLDYDMWKKYIHGPMTNWLISRRSCSASDVEEDKQGDWFCRYVCWLNGQRSRFGVVNVKLFRIDRRRAESPRSAGVRTGALTFPARVTQKTHIFICRGNYTKCRKKVSRSLRAPQVTSRIVFKFHKKFNFRRGWIIHWRNCFCLFGPCLLTYLFLDKSILLRNLICNRTDPSHFHKCEMHLMKCEIVCFDGVGKNRKNLGRVDWLGTIS